MRDSSSALGAKTARACDSCIIKRASWFCAADDAFLCHGCDNLVHSANNLARRHERVTTQQQAWHSGFTRKARTPRHHNKDLSLQQRPKDEEQEVIFNKNSGLPLVPELGGEESLFDDEIEEHMLCRVPVLHPFDSKICGIYNNELNDGEAFDLDKFSELLPSDVDLAEFAADVESLLDKDSGVTKGPEMPIDCKEEDEIMVKVKDEELGDDMACHLESVFDMASDEVFDWNIIESESMTAAENEEGEEEEKVVVVESGGGSKKERLLRLNYEEVIAAWESQGSPWTTGNPPEFKSCDYLCTSGADIQCTYGDLRSLRGHDPILGSGDGGREARVSRYREKRRTRLFAKKIRYQVRKLNAEKRPRMKGRFVKRTATSFNVGASSAFPPQLPLTSK